jgi:hypothetical protein
MSTYREKALSYLTIVRLSDKLLGSGTFSAGGTLALAKTSRIGPRANPHLMHSSAA